MKYNINKIDVEILLNERYNNYPYYKVKDLKEYYKLLGFLRQKNNKARIYALENEIEVYIDNIIQLEINDDLNFGFNEAFKQVVRHNPDYIIYYNN